MRHGPERETTDWKNQTSGRDRTNGDATLEDARDGQGPSGRCALGATWHRHTVRVSVVRRALGDGARREDAMAMPRRAPTPIGMKPPPAAAVPAARRGKDLNLLPPTESSLNDAHRA